MPWPFVPSLIYNDSVSVVHNAWGQDAVLAPMVNPVSSVTDPPVRCTVNPEMSQGETEGLDGTIQRVTNKVTYRVTFPKDVAAKPRDFLLWCDKAGVTRTLVVTSYLPFARATPEWWAYAIERS